MACVESKHATFVAAGEVKYRHPGTSPEGHKFTIKNPLRSAEPSGFASLHTDMTYFRALSFVSTARLSSLEVCRQNLTSKYDVTVSSLYRCRHSEL